MKILALADIHGQVQKIAQLSSAAADCDAIILAGDITDFGGREQAVSVLSELSHFDIPVMGVPGNCDGSQVDDTLKQRGGSLIQNVIETNSFAFMGFPYIGSDESALPLPNYLVNRSGRKIVLVTHQPAWGTDVDLQASTRHKGSRPIRSFIEDYQPVLAVSGHIHEAYGIDRIGSTVLVNPGPFHNGRYAIIDLSDESVQAKLHWL